MFGPFRSRKEVHTAIDLATNGMKPDAKEAAIYGVLEDLGIINDDDEDSKSSSYFDYDDEDGYDFVE